MIYEPKLVFLIVYKNFWLLVTFRNRCLRIITFYITVSFLMYVFEQK